MAIDREGAAAVAGCSFVGVGCVWRIVSLIGIAGAAYFYGFKWAIVALVACVIIETVAQLAWPFAAVAIGSLFGRSAKGRTSDVE